MPAYFQSARFHYLYYTRQQWTLNSVTCWQGFVSNSTRQRRGDYYVPSSHIHINEAKKTSTELNYVAFELMHNGRLTGSHQLSYANSDWISANSNTITNTNLFMHIARHNTSNQLVFLIIFNYIIYLNFVVQKNNQQLIRFIKRKLFLLLGNNL